MVTFYQLMCFFLPISLILWIIDFLSDSYITKNETKIGIMQYIHHIIAIIAFSGPFINIFVNNLTMLILSIILMIGIQIGFLYNNDYCWLTIMINKMIDPNRPKRKWRGEIESLIKHYVRGDSWAYSDIHHIDFSNSVIIINILFIFALLKIIMSRIYQVSH
jgi:hypothetical protein